MSSQTDVLRIQGNIPLRGTVAVKRAKNSALYLILASLLTPEAVLLEGIPRLSDVRIILEILEHVGVQVERRGDDLKLQAKTVHTCAAPYRLVSKMRASFVTMGALLARCGAARISMPGGCAFGPRPVDRHIRAFHELGIHIDEEGGDFIARREGSLGGRVVFEAPTVGGTQNVILASALGSSQVVIENAALEPEVNDLADMLNTMGASVSGAGTRVITIRGASYLKGTRYRPIPDRIEAGTFMLAAAATRGRLTLTEVIPSHLRAVIAKLEEAGVAVRQDDEETLTIDASGPLRAVDIAASEYPGIPTDLQAPFGAFLATVPGRSSVVDQVYPDRYTHVEELLRSGAKVDLHERTLDIEGGKLHGARMHAADLRAGGALVIAALAAKGTSVISGLRHIDRGYEALPSRLRQLGADVRREPAALLATGTYGD